MLPIMPTRTLNKDDLLALIYGTCFLASGGGGPISMALKFLDKIPANSQIKLIPASNLDADKKALVVVDVGSPAAVEAGYGATAPLNAYKSMSKRLNSPINYLLPGELGAVNSLIPFYLAAINSQIEGVIDADMCGRAAPRLSQTLLNAKHIACCPAVIASDSAADGTFLDATFEHLTPTGLEYAARKTVIKEGFHGVAGIALYPLETNFIKSPKAQNALAYHSISTAIAIGKQLLQSLNLDDLGTLLSSLQIENRQLVRGKIATIATPSGQGFDYIKMVVSNDHEEFWLYIKNETLLIWDALQLRCRAIAPDCINLIQRSKAGHKPISTAEAKMGDEVSVWLTACPQSVRSTDLIAQFKEDIQSILTAFPEDGIPTPEFQSIEALN